MRSTLISGLVLFGFVALVYPVARTKFHSQAQVPPPPPATATPGLPVSGTPGSLPARIIAPVAPGAQPPALPVARTNPGNPPPSPSRVETAGFTPGQGQGTPAGTQTNGPSTVNPGQTGWAGRMETDRSNLPPLTRQMLLTSRRGADWLARMNGVKGLFSPGIEPAIREEATDEGMLRQIGAAWALGRAAQAFGEQKYEARALQTLLCALEETTTDPADPKTRFTSIPQVLMPRVQGTAFLTLALIDHNSPPTDMVERAEEMASYLRRETQEELKGANTQASRNPGQKYLVAYTLLKSNKVRPAPWKVELAGALIALGNGPVTAQAQPWQGMALAEWARTRGDREAAAKLYAVCEELTRWQITKLDPIHPRFQGGFQPPIASGTQPAGTQLAPPTTTTSAAIVMTLAEGAQLSREMGDASRNQSLMEAVDLGTQFIAQQQYTEATTQHFAEWYRPLLEGGFRDTEKDGTLNLPTQQIALVAMLQCLKASAP